MLKECAMVFLLTSTLRTLAGSSGSRQDLTRSCVAIRQNSRITIVTHNLSPLALIHVVKTV